MCIVISSVALINHESISPAARFDGLEFLRRWRGKRIKFVGDSLGMNQWASLVCMLHAAVPAPARVTVIRTNGKAVSTVRFEVHIACSSNCSEGR